MAFVNAPIKSKSKTDVINDTTLSINPLMVSNIVSTTFWNISVKLNESNNSENFSKPNALATQETKSLIRSGINP